MKQQKPQRRAGYAATGIIRSSDPDPKRPRGQVERDNSMRTGILQQLYSRGEIEATVHERGGLFFTRAQEIAAIAKCTEMDLFID